ncbi:uncharacterized protein LAESUDRAFT_728803 [Laetiporus sulphureus 93-53]|uniref:CsbD-like domain-containing protein n=1 Tax=Laetiporus sulphureus 93-53 TaxID=1314785 RepID=A0A165CZ09_9APHY|nr:uncharacterized protein LAESUDRAFT_728803 [Laetiporus sulphureus 93-53]KZT03782.1 hypothetical protein LAESUDRAFT_728803 [Laetiporus sulphureus 93-53]
MPLFKSKEKNTRAQAAEQKGRHDPNQYESRGIDTNTVGGTTALAGTGGVPYENDGTTHAVGSGGHHTLGSASGRTGYNDTTGYGNTEQRISPTDNVNTSNLHGGGGVRGAEGRVEQKVGELIGSQALQAKGAEKEQEAQAFKAQSSELAEAERLEREAVMRRERAVAQGAHPANKQLGGPDGVRGNDQTY